MVCKICGGACENTVYLLKNVRKDLQETFEYVKCSECGCLQIREIPENLGDYYDKAVYYGFKSTNIINTNFELYGIDGRGGEG